MTDTIPAALVRALPDWLDRELYPFTPHTFATPEGKLSYLDEGPRDAPLVVLVHGTPSSSFEWRHVVRALRDSHRVIAVDHLGFGLSDKPLVAALRPADHARRLATLLDHLDARDVTLVVHDFGGPIGLGAALEDATRVRALVLLNTWAWPLATFDPAFARASRVVRSFVGRFLYLCLNASPRFLVPRAFADEKKLTPRIHAQYVGPFLRREDRLAPWVLGCELTGSDDFYATLWARRAALHRVPTMIVWGKSDALLGVHLLAKLVEGFPHARVRALEGVGHFPTEEAPEEVITAIREVTALGRIEP